MYQLILRYLLAVLLLSSYTVVHAQQFGGNPPAIKWNQVNAPAARVIFPQGLDSAGYRVASIIQQIN
jgi:hypothetical protein